MLTIRHAEPRDAEGIADVCASAARVLRPVYRPKPSVAKWRAERADRSRRLVACREDRVVGTVEYYFEDGDLCLLGLFVHHDFRRQGVGRQLVAHADQIARAAGVPRVTLWCIRETGNEAVFQRWGFETVHAAETDMFESDRHATLVDVQMARPVGR